MCGLAGVFGRVADTEITAAVRALAHRGPDDQGLWSDPAIPATLGHRRLSILDLSSAGHQPFASADGRFHLVFNGEIYNFRAVRAELERHGHVFHSATDTEVIPAAYAQWGRDFVHRLRGMFAFALLDTRPPAGRPRLLLGRDRLGIKPLIYGRSGGAWWFASEVRALLATGAFARRVNPEGLLDFLAWGAAHQPRTLVDGLHMVPPGHLLELDGDRATAWRYWDLHEATGSRRTEAAGWTDEEAAARTRALLEDATRLHLVSDVPVGAFLSGGVDSATAVAMMSRLTRTPVETVCVGFAPPLGAVDESAQAAETARFLGTRHQTCRLAPDDAAQLFPVAVQALDQPSADGFNTWLVARAARRTVKVAISGLGGDEFWAGYPHFADPVYQRIDAPYQNLRRVLTDRDLRSGLRGDWAPRVAGHLGAFRAGLTVPSGDPLQRISYVEQGHYLLDTLLRDSDAMSMAHGLELRPVLLDHVLVEHAYALPPHQKLRAGRTKIALLNAVRAALPPGLEHRPKTGFGLPYAGWMSGPLRPYFEHLLASAAAGTLLRRSFRLELALRLRAGRPPARLWALGTLWAWLEQERMEIG